MAKLLNPETMLEVTLFAPTRIGRSRDNQIIVKDEHASKHHAVIFRRGGQWYLESLGKTNGTWLDGELLQVQETRALQRGARIRLGRSGDTPGQRQPEPM
jgi:pSer/pThr/pTyr-binding forkhead associated (FHA) protein